MTNEIIIERSETPPLGPQKNCLNSTEVKVIGTYIFINRVDAYNIQTMRTVILSIVRPCLPVALSREKFTVGLHDGYIVIG